MEFFFNYDAPDEVDLEVKPATAGFGVEIHALADLAKKWGQWPSFVEEWHAYCQKVNEEWPFPESDSSEPPSEEEMEAIHDAFDCWGPSSSFDPNEAKIWANRWIQFWDEMIDEEAKQLFPDFDTPLHRRDAPFGRDFQIKELRKLVQQTECAEKHQVKMNMVMVMG
ncbi:MAG TPA: hypothetical protein VGB77_15475 [Abditibacteriaceae bacterium]|jgi:hypothetical protein